MTQLSASAGDEGIFDSKSLQPCKRNSDDKKCNKKKLKDKSISECSVSIKIIEYSKRSKENTSKRIRIEEKRGGCLL